LSRRFAHGVFVVAAVLAPAPVLAEPVASDPESACIGAYETLQEARAGGALLTARAQAFECSSSVCPAFIQKDCSAWLDEIEAEMPTVTFDVRSGGKSLTRVRVLEGERVLADGLGGAPVELDPGAHSLRFEAEGREPATRSFDVERGRKNQRLAVELPAPAAAAAPPAPSPQPPPPQPAPPVESEGSTVAYVVGGIGIAGIAGFAILGATGLSQEASLDQRCAPHCSEAELRALRNRYLLADVSLGVGIAGLFVGGYLLFSPSPNDRSAKAPSVVVQASSHGAMATVRSAF
jgi:hypothetical protein